MDERLDEWMNGQVDEWIDGWIQAWMDVKWVDDGHADR